MDSCVMDSCRDCLRLEQRFRAASEYYVSLIGNGNSEASAHENLMRKARRRRNAAGLWPDENVNQPLV